MTRVIIEPDQEHPKGTLPPAMKPQRQRQQEAARQTSL